MLIYSVKEAVDNFNTVKQIFHSIVPINDETGIRQKL